MPRLQYQACNQASTEREEQELLERREHARKSLSGSCAGDYLTATTVKEKPRRQTTGSRLRVALGHDDRGPRPPVCAHDPLNDFRALSHQRLVCASHCTSNWRHRRRTLRTFRNQSIAPTFPTLSPLTGSIEHVTCQPRVSLVGNAESRGTSRRRTAFR